MPKHTFRNSIASPETFEAVLRGEHLKIYFLFCWDETPQGHEHWRARAEGIVPLSESDRAYLKRCLELDRLAEDGE